MKKSIRVALLCVAISLSGLAREHSRQSTHAVRHHTTYAPHPNVTAVCNDGTVSYSAHRRGTCSHHGGVRRWNARGVR
jgi:hypothetical protein